MKPKIFNISIGLLSLNIFSSSFLHLLQIIERTNVFSKVCDILQNFQIFYTYHKSPNILFHLSLLVVENILVLP